MEPKLSDQIIQACPILFRSLNYIEAPDGWFELIRATSKTLEVIAKNQKVMGQDPIAAQQIKSKFGGLRFYCSAQNEHADPIIAFSERLSTKLCEVCGEFGTTKSHGWIWTLCEKHHIAQSDEVKRRNQHA